MSNQPVIISIGATPNDGTGDAIRDAFDKVNQNFQTLYSWVLGTGTSGLKFIDLLDSPGSYTTASGNVATGVVLVTVNNAANSLTNRLLITQNGITANTSDNGLITLGYAYTASITATAYSVVLRDSSGTIQDIVGQGVSGSTSAAITLLVDGLNYRSASTSSISNTVAARDGAGNLYATNFIGNVSGVITNANTSSYANTASFANTSSYSNTASFAHIATSASSLLLNGAYVSASTSSIANTIVGRDGLGQIYATTFVGSLAGNVVANQVTISPYSAGTYTVALVANTGTQTVYRSTTLNYNNGTLYSTDFGATSDANLKTIVGNIPNALDKINSINGVQYYWNERAKAIGIDSDNLQLGVLAQEVQQVAPEAVSEVDGSLRVNYDKLIPLLIEAIKELKKKVDGVN